MIRVCYLVNPLAESPDGSRRMGMLGAITFHVPEMLVASVVAFVPYQVSTAR